MNNPKMSLGRKDLDMYKHLIDPDYPLYGISFNTAHSVFHPTFYHMAFHSISLETMAFHSEDI